MALYNNLSLNNNRVEPSDITRQEDSSRAVPYSDSRIVQASFSQLTHPTLKEVVHYPGLAFYTFKLGNGFNVNLAHMPESVGVATALTVKAGSRLEAEHESGIAHFAEHYTCAGTKTFPSSQAIWKEIANLGVMFNAHTDRDLIWYEAYGPEDTAENVLKLLSEIVLKPDFDKLQFNSIQEEVLTELATLANDTYSIFTDTEIPRTLFPNSSFTRSIMGSVETIASFTPEQIRDYHNYYFTPANMEIFIAGRLPFNLPELVEKHFGDSINTHIVQPIIPLPSSVWDQPGADRFILRPLDDPSKMGAEVFVNFPLLIDSSKAAAARVFRHILTGSPVSRLNDLLCHQQPITRWVRSSIEHYYHSFNVATIETQLNNATNLGAVVESIQNAIGLLATKGPRNDEIHQASIFGKFECERLLHQPVETVEYMMEQQQHGDFLHPFQLTQDLARVTIDDIKDIAAQFTPEKLFVAAIGGLDEKIMATVQKITSPSDNTTNKLSGKAAPPSQFTAA